MQSVSPEERRRRDEVAIAEYRRLRDAGERRRLVRAATGDLVLYRPEEAGFARGGPGYSVRTLAGLRVGVVVLGILTLASLVAVVLPVAGGSSPAWPALTPAVIAGGLMWWVAVWASRERRAAALRRERGLPEPARHPY